MAVHTGSYCQCEHVCHIEDLERSPNGKRDVHAYGQAFTEHNIVPVLTEYGTFHVCLDCANDCYAQYPRVSNQLVK